MYNYKILNLEEVHEINLNEYEIISIYDNKFKVRKRMTSYLLKKDCENEFKEFIEDYKIEIQEYIELNEDWENTLLDNFNKVDLYAWIYEIANNNTPIYYSDIFEVCYNDLSMSEIDDISLTYGKTEVKDILQMCIYFNLEEFILNNFSYWIVESILGE